MRSKSDRNEADFKDFDFDGFEAETTIEEPKKKKVVAKQAQPEIASAPAAKDQSLESKFKRVLLRWVLPGLGVAIVFLIIGLVAGVSSMSKQDKPELPVVEIKEARSVLQEVSDIKDSQIAMLQKQVAALNQSSSGSSVNTDALTVMSSVADTTESEADPMFDVLLSESPNMTEDEQSVLKSDLASYMSEDLIASVLAGSSPAKELKAEVVKVGSPILCPAAVNSDESVVYLASVSITSNDATYNVMYITTFGRNSTGVIDLKYVGLVKSDSIVNVADTVGSMIH